MRATLLGIILVLLATTAQSRTWRVNTAGTGDAPTLYAAMDSVAAFDVVLVEAGDYPLNMATLVVPPNVQLVGENGPTQTLLYSTNYMGQHATMSLRSNARLSGVRVEGSTTVLIVTAVGVVLENCILVGDGWAISGQQTEYHNCLFVEGVIHSGASVFVGSIVLSHIGSGSIESLFYLCDVFGGSVHPGIEIPPENGNFSLDPQFCGIPGSGNYYLQSTSPCLPANNPFISPGYVVGPLPQGCSTVSVEKRTWGSIKAMYLKR